MYGLVFILGPKEHFCISLPYHDMYREVKKFCGPSEKGFKGCSASNAIQLVGKSVGWKVRGADGEMPRSRGEEYTLAGDVASA